MISSRRIVSPSHKHWLTEMSSGSSALVKRNGDPFIFVKRFKDQIQYGPVDEECKPLISESTKLSINNLNPLIEFLKLNKEHNIEIVMEK